MGSEQRGSKHAMVRSQEWRGGAEKVRPPAGKRDESREKREDRRRREKEREQRGLTTEMAAVRVLNNSN